MNAETPTTTPASGSARLWASAWDYLVIIGWLAVLTVVGFAVRVLLPPTVTRSPFAADAVTFGFSVLPIWVYLTVTEAGSRQASWGKRRAGLLGGRIGWRPSQVGACSGSQRGEALLPWQLAHITVAR